MLFKPATSVRGTLTLPGDKSISHRSAMIASLAAGKTHIRNFAASADCLTTLDAMRSLGVKIDRSGSDVLVNGAGATGLAAPAEVIDCGNSGTTMRLLIGILAGQRFGSKMIGDESLSRRPMKRVIDPLRRMGASITSTNGQAPLEIAGGQTLTGADHLLKVASAQVKSCILLAGLFANGQTSVVEPVATRDHTERMLRWFGAEVKTDEQEKARIISIEGGQKLRGQDVDVPGDISSAAFFLVAAACLRDSQLTLKNVGVNPTRTGIIEVLKRAGVDILLENELSASNEPVADLKVTGTIKPGDVDRSIVRGNIVANLIDEIPILAVLGTQLAQGIEFRDAGELRVKESDRITSTVENLRRLGASVDEFDDGFRVHRSELRGAELDSFGDHRIAMAFSIAALLAKGETTIGGSECTEISFPGFYQTLKSVIV